MKDTMKSEAVTLAEGYRTEFGRYLLDADPDEYIIKPDGSMDFGEISEDVARDRHGVSRGKDQALSEES